MISIETKKKELIGDCAREGTTYTQVPVDARDCLISPLQAKAN